MWLAMALGVAGAFAQEEASSLARDAAAACQAGDLAAAKILFTP
jgi:hypothetical protein